MSDSMIAFLGIELSKYLNINLIVTKGIISLAIQDEYGFVEDLTLNKLEQVLKGGLKNRLNTLIAHDTDRIIEDLDKALRKNQSILTMACI